MKADARKGNRDLDPDKSYYHLKIISKLFRDAEKRAWASISRDPAVEELINKRKSMKIREIKKLKKTRTYNDSIDPLLNLYK